MHRRACAVVALVLSWPVLSWAAPAGKQVAIIRPVTQVQAQESVADEVGVESEAAEPSEEIGMGAPIYEQGGDDEEQEYDESFQAPGASCNQDTCAPSGWPSCEGPGRGFWGRAEALGFWVRGAHSPALVSTSPAGTLQPMAGVLPAATVLFPTRTIDPVGRFGGRLTLGYWFDDKEESGFQGSFFALDDPQHPYSASSNGSRILARPFFNTATIAEDAGLVAFPGLLSGSIGVHTSSKLLGADLNLREAFYQTRHTRFDWLAGYRYFQFNDALGIQANSQVIDPRGGSAPLGTTINAHDSFSARNTFNGGQVGVIMQHGYQRWGCDVLGKFAFGSNWQHVSINGRTVVTVPGQTPIVDNGGFLALVSNSGSFSRKAFSFIPELNTNLYYQLTPIWRVNAGYTLLFMTNVVRSGDQIDRAINPLNFPPVLGAGTPPPAFAFHESTLWVQGLSLGVEARF